jgi:hypothetical protein
VTVDGTPTAEFTDLATNRGRVTGWHQVFPAGSRLARAEASVRAALPADARQVASWRGSFAVGGRHCEFVDYQSVSLASQLGSAVPTSSEGDIGVKFYEATSHGPGTSGIATVNSAQVSAEPFTQGEPC